MENQRKLTIIMPTYNRESYIREALDSVLMQETNYPYEIVIADDCSTDSSLIIAQEYQTKHPQIIRILPSQTNQKLYKNILRAYADLKTDYFCVLDPDDFWTDKHKIQKALDFLESHRDYTMYCANTLLKDENNTMGGGQLYIATDKKNMSYDFSHFLKGKGFIFGHTSSSIFRNIFTPTFLEKMANFEPPTKEASFRGDSFRNICALQKGKGYFQNEVDSVYRLTTTGIWTSNSPLKQNIMNCNFHKDMWLFFDKAYSELLQRAYILYHRSIISQTQMLLNELNLEPIYQLQETSQILESSKCDIQTRLLKKAKLKYRIYFKLYHKIGKKLAKKGLL